MNVLPPPPPPRNSKVNDQYRIPTPKKIKEVPQYIKKVLSTTLEKIFYIVKLVWEASPAILFVLVFMTLFNGVMPVIGSIIGKEILNNLAKAYNNQLSTFQIITTLLILQFIYLLIHSVIVRIYATLMRISGELVANYIKIKLMTKSKEVDLACYDSPDYYAKLENANREAANRPIEALSATFSIISTLISIISYIIVITVIGILPALLIILIAIPSTLINFFFRRKNFTYMFRRSKDRRQLNYYSEIVFNKDLVKEIRILGLSDTFIQKYKNVFNVYFSGLKKLMLQECVWNIGATLLSTAVNCVLFVMIARGVFERQYEVGNYALFTGALTAIAAGISSLITTSASIYESTLFINNMISFMKEKPKIISTLTSPRCVSNGTDHRIVFENVSFHYPNATVDVLKHVNLVIEPKDSIVIVGLNGAGKTTLIKLLMRLYDPSEGRILLDGHDIREYDVVQLYSLFGIVFQDYGKYAVSIKENISFGKVLRPMNQDDIEEAAKHSNSSDFIEKLPHQYDTSLMRYFEDEGTELSIGQWQKLAIARAFYSKSDILILDEPTASLDAIAEQEIFYQFDELRRDKTTIFVSHRLSSAVSATKIVVLEDGALIEEGNHHVLMNNKGKYYELFSTQAKRYVESYEAPTTKSVGKPLFK